MCGIVGFFDKNTLNKNRIKNLTSQITHRGPDEEGYYTNYKGVYFGVRRLSIIDIDHGKQPVESEKYVLVFNGEILNFKELRNKYLSKKKYIKSDTKILLLLIEKFGLKILSELNGFFVIAIFNKLNNKILIIRDRFGIKPLYYTTNKSSFYFCSEIKPLKNILNITDLDTSQVNNFFTLGYVYGENRIFKNIKMLSPGSILEYNVNNNQKKFSKWVDIKRDISKLNSINQKDTYSIFKKKIFSAVHTWSRSDVDKVFTLSGGLDSSIIAAISAKQEKINTISFVYKKNDKFNRFNEVNNSDLLAKKLKSNHEKYYWSPSDFKNDLFDIIDSLEEPFGNSLLPWFLFKKIKKTFKVCITGNGGDELFGNYRRVENYKKLNNNFYNISNFEKNYFNKIYQFNRSLQNKYLLNKSENPSKIYYKVFENGKKLLDKERNLALVDYLTHLREDQLFSEDKMSMKHSVETRTPFLDIKLFKFVYSLKKKRTTPKEYKYLLSKLGRHLLPNEVLKSEKKGFSMPLSIFMRENFCNEVKHYLSRKNLTKTGYVNKEFYNDFVLPMLKGNNNNIQIIWNMLIFHIWFINS